MNTTRLIATASANRINLPMNAPVVSRSVLVRWMAGAAVGLAGAVLAAGSESAKADAVPVKLEKIVVMGAADYRPIEVGWEMGEVPGFRIFSHRRSIHVQVAEQLQLARSAAGLLGLPETLLKQPVTVVVTASEREFRAWSGLARDAVDLATSGVATPAGLVLVVNGAEDDVHRAVGRSYVLALLRNTGMPRWLQEGVAQIANSTEAKGDHLQVGGVQQDPRNRVSVAALREVNTMLMSDPGTDTSGGSQYADAGGLTNNRGDVMQIRINDVVPSKLELEDHISRELVRRDLERFTYAPTTDFFSYLAENPPMPLGEILDPAASDTVDWRMNAWAFTHYGMFGDGQRNRPAFFRFVEQLGGSSARPPGQVFEENFKVSPDKFRETLADYIGTGGYAIHDFKLAEPFQAVKPTMADISEANVLQLRARVLVNSGREEEARQLLARGYVNPANRTSSYVTMLAGLERSRDLGRATEFLEQADRREPLDNPGQRLLAELRWERLRQGGVKLSRDDLREVLRPLYVALEQGDRSEGLFVMIGRAWTTAAESPKPENLEILRVGLTYHPKSQRLTDLLKQLESS